MTMQTVAVGGLKGGTGKTSITLHLARDLSTARRRVVVADLDPQQSAVQWAQAREGRPLPFTVHALDARRGAFPFKRQLDHLTRDADLVLLDLPPELGNVSRIAYMVADLVLIPVTPGAFDLRAAYAAVQLARDARKERKGKLPLVSLVPSRLIARTRLAAELPTALRALGETVAPGIGQRVAVAESSITGRLVSPGSPAGQEFQALARHVQRGLRNAKN